MRCEWPSFQRCCFCLPLRYGLIGVGYLKLVIDLAMVFIMVFNIRVWTRTLDVGSILLSATLLYFIVDVISHIFLIIGGYKKDPTILCWFYRYSLVILAVNIIASAALVVLDLVVMYQSKFLWLITLSYVIFVFVASCLSVVLNLYLISHVKSEIEKLKNDIEFQFTNNLHGTCAPTKPYKYEDDKSPSLSTEHLDTV